ncbi:hypothetical protein WMY93_005391 [Mugilogobius chulae]|uniref:Ig-like domain-containing protein n=1 Tax=Mugilogobius chulae TaxID=88201 RepID=A0AAW0PLD0_9GOBI
MGASLLWTLSYILFSVVVCKQATGDNVTLSVPSHTVYLEDTVTLYCSGHDGKHVQFYKDGSPAQLDSQHVLEQGQYYAYLAIYSASQSDDGLYSCGTNNETQSAQKLLTATASSRRVEVTVSNTDSPAGGSVTLSCDVHDWNGKLKWYRAAGPFSPKENIDKYEKTVSVSQRGVYYCRGVNGPAATKQSTSVTVVDTVPTVRVSESEVFVGERVSLRCEVEGGADTDWTYHWRKNRLNLCPTSREYTVWSVSESDRGEYSCRAQRGPHITTVWSTSSSVSVQSESVISLDFRKKQVNVDVTNIEVELIEEEKTGDKQDRTKDRTLGNTCGDGNWVRKASVTLQTPVRPVYQGDSVTLLCSGPAQRHLHFYKDGSQLQLKRTTSDQLTISGVSKSDEGQYSCGINEKVQSDTWRLTVTERHRRVTVTPLSSAVSAVGSVILSCNIEGFTEGYRWFRGESSLSKTSQWISVSRGGEYSCRGQDQFILTPQSLTVTVIETVSVTPNGPEVFVGERVSLRCEVEGGADTDWTYHWRKNRLNLRPTSREYTVWSVSESDRGEYSCRAQRGPHITTVWSTSSSVSVLLNKPQVTVTGASQLLKGDSVQLFCSVSPSSSGWKYDWSRNEQLFKESSSEAQVTVSEAGEYQCRAHRGEPPYFTELSHKLSLTVTGEAKGDVSSFPVMWVVGPVCAVVLLILLLLLWSYIKTKGKSSSSENGEAGESQDNQQQLYSSLLHGREAKKLTDTFTSAHTKPPISHEASRAALLCCLLTLTALTCHVLLSSSFRRSTPPRT